MLKRIYLSIAHEGYCFQAYSFQPFCFRCHSAELKSPGEELSQLGYESYMIDIIFKRRCSLM